MLSAKLSKGVVQAKKHLQLQTHLEVFQVRHYIVGQPFSQQLKSPCPTTQLSARHAIGDQQVKSVRLYLCSFFVPWTAPLCPCRSCVARSSRSAACILCVARDVHDRPELSECCPLASSQQC